MRLRLVVADDHPLFRGALKDAVLGAVPEADVREAGDFETLLALLAADPDVDLVLFDLAMPGVRGLSGLLVLRAEHPGVPVTVVSANDDPVVVRRCMEFGASGYVPKTLAADAMRTAVRRVLAGEVYVPPGVDLAAGTNPEVAEIAARLSTLTPQQLRVLAMLSEGLLNKQIAFELKVSEATVKAHVSAILTKLKVESRTQAVITAARVEIGGRPGATPSGPH